MTVTHARRREHLAALLPAHEADAILVTHGVNVRYLTGLDSSNAAVLVRADATATLATDSRYTETARRICSDIEVIEERDVAGSLVSRARRIGVEADHLSVADYFRLGEDLLRRVRGWWRRCAWSRTRPRSSCSARACAIADQALADVPPSAAARADRAGGRPRRSTPHARAGRRGAGLRDDRGQRAERRHPAPPPDATGRCATATC